MGARGWFLWLLVGASTGCGDDPGVVRFDPAFLVGGGPDPVVVDLPATRTMWIEHDGPGPVNVTASALSTDDDSDVRLLLPAQPGAPWQINANERFGVRVAVLAHRDGLADLRLALSVDGGAPTPVHAALRKVPPPSCDDDNPCTLDAVDEDTGGCVHEVLDGPCDDGDACTVNTTCVAGVCQGEARACDDGVACTLDVCDPEQGCQAVPDDSRCDDGVPCSDDVCTAAGCVHPGAADGTPCGAAGGCDVVEVCLNQTCVAVGVPEGAPCDDGDACTTGDVCAQGVCGGVGLDGPPPGLGAFMSRWIEPREVTLVEDGAITAAVLGERSTLQTVSFSAGPEAPAVQTHFDLSGRLRSSQAVGESIGDLARLDDGRYARMRQLGAETLQLEVLTFAPPHGLTVDQSLLVPLRPGPTPALAVAGTRLVGCAGSTSSPDGVSVQFDLVTGTVAFDEDVAGFCRPTDAPRWAFGADVVGRFGVDSFAAFRFDGTSLSTPGALSFATDGVSNYGEIEAGFVNHRGLLVDLEHPTKYFFSSVTGLGNVYGNAPGLGGRPIVGLDGDTVLIGHDFNHIVLGTLSADATSISIDESSLIWVPSLAAPLPGVPSPRFEVLDVHDHQALVRAPGGLTALVHLELGQPLLVPPQSAPLADITPVGAGVGLVTDGALLGFDALADTLLPPAPRHTRLPRGFAHLLADNTGPVCLLNPSPDRWGSTADLFHLTPRLTEASLGVWFETGSPVLDHDWGPDLLDQLPGPATFEANGVPAGSGCTLVFTNIDGTATAYDLCSQALATIDGKDWFSDFVLYGEPVRMHDASHFSLLSVYGDALLVAIEDQALVVERAAATDDNFIASNAALSDELWVLSTVSRVGVDAHLHVFDRADGALLDTIALPPRDGFHPSDPVDILAIDGDLIYVEHHDAGHEQILVFGPDADGSYVEHQRLDLPARARAVAFDGPDLYLLTEAGVGQSPLVCAP